MNGISSLTGICSQVALVRNAKEWSIGDPGSGGIGGLPSGDDDGPEFLEAGDDDNVDHLWEKSIIGGVETI